MGFQSCEEACTSTAVQGPHSGGAAAAGAQREEAKDAIFWDLFQVRNPHTGELAEPWVPCEAAAVKGQKFVLHKVRLAHGDGSRLLTMRFRCAPRPRLLPRAPHASLTLARCCLV